MKYDYKRKFLETQLASMEENRATLVSQLEQATDPAIRERGGELLKATDNDLHNLRIDLSRLSESEGAE